MAVAAAAQRVKLILPAQPVVTGTAFQVQYIVPAAGEVLVLSAPEFGDCRVVSGPNFYAGTMAADGRPQPVQNVAYTLVPLKPGELSIGVLRVSVKGTLTFESDPASVLAVLPPKASFSARSSFTDASLYAPPVKKDVQQLIRDNLFVKAEVSKQACFLGEPVVVTFKLYSRLQSTSEAEKSPSFYGFGVIDMASLNEAHPGVETINGKVFNTAVLRQVQLFPERTGMLTIDPMYVANEIEFVDSSTNQKTVLSKELVTDPVQVMVYPLPAKAPAAFAGAVGYFGLQARWEAAAITASEPAQLLLTITGAGNFLQFSQPAIAWPRGLEPFETGIVDQLDKARLPLGGSRQYRISVAADSAGSYGLPPVRFSFFDPVSRSYRSLSTDSLLLTVMPAKKKAIAPVIGKQKEGGRLPWWLLIPVLALLVPAGLWLKRRRQTVPAVQLARTDVPDPLAGIEATDPKQACIRLGRVLQQLLREKGSTISPSQKLRAESLLNECRLQAYAQGSNQTVSELKAEVRELWREAHET